MTRVPPGSQRWWIKVQNALTVGVLIVAPMFEGRGGMPSRSAGALAILLGAVVGVLGVRHLGINRTPHPAPRPSGELVTSGIYSHVRHPLYASLIMVCFGWSILWFSYPGLGMTLLLAVFLDRKARCEEQWLLERFPAYAAYMARVCRFLPRIY